MLSSVSDDIEHGDIPEAVEATRGKRKLGDTGKPCRHQSLRAAGSRHPNYAGRPTQERPKRQRKTSEPETGEQSVGSVVAAAPET
ncbi:unnamed protein product, partial [Ectocarpus fasciculatus]